MNRTNKPALLILIAVVASLVGCATETTTEAKSPEAEVVAQVGDQTITMAELEKEAAVGLKKIAQDRYELFRRTLDDMASQRTLAVEAASRGMTTEELLVAEVNDKVIPPTDSEIAGFYEINKDRMGGKTLDQMRADLSTYLIRQKQEELKWRFFQRLRAENQLRILLEPPRTEIGNVEGQPARGPEDAPVTIVEFADFQCPYCRRAHPVLERVLTEYQDNVRFIFRDYPLDNHRRAVPASEAARCADDQGKFWDYYQNLMVMTGDLSDENLKTRAADVGLNTDEFMACLASGRHTAAVKQGFEDGQTAGVTATPTFFINGRMLVGAKSYDDFKMIIDEELASSGTTEPEDENVGG